MENTKEKKNSCESFSVCKNNLNKTKTRLVRTELPSKLCDDLLAHLRKVTIPIRTHLNSNSSKWGCKPYLVWLDNHFVFVRRLLDSATSTRRRSPLYAPLTMAFQGKEFEKMCPLFLIWFSHLMVPGIMGSGLTRYHNLNRAGVNWFVVCLWRSRPHLQGFEETFWPEELWHWDLLPPGGLKLTSLSSTVYLNPVVGAGIRSGVKIRLGINNSRAFRRIGIIFAACVCPGEI